MILLNETDKVDTITKKDYRTIIELLNPFAPHITEEINEICSLGETLCNSNWPKYDETKIVDATYEMVVQVNGKVRGKIEVSTDTSKEDMEILAKKIDKKNITDSPQATIDDVPNYYLTTLYLAELKERNAQLPKLKLQMSRFNDDF